MCDSTTYVLVLYDFEYEGSDGKKVDMKEGEEFLLLNKTNNDWWQVIRDGERRPFYAPASYMEEVTLEQRKNRSNQKRKKPEPLSRSINSKIKSQSAGNIIDSEKYEPKLSIMKSRSLDKLNSDGKVTSGLMFSNPLYDVTESELDNKSVFIEPEIDYSDADSEGDDGRTENVKTAKDGVEVVKNLPLNPEVQCIVVTERKVPLEEEKHQKRASISPIYANLPLNSYGRPPSPKSEDSPTKILLHHWAEYEDSNGRKYYYNYVTREKSWKPPRRRSEKFLSLSSLSAEELSFPTSTTEKSDDSSPSSTFSSPVPNVPLGWSQKYDEDTDEICFINDITKEKWFSSTDEQGRLYYYQENASESFWQLPEVIITEAEKTDKGSATKQEISCNEMHISPSSSSPSTSPQIKRPPLLRPSSLADRGLKTRSMILTNTRSSTLPRNSSGQHLLNLHVGHLKITRQGILNKTKLIEGGKRLRKNWSPSFIVLSDVFLLFYKDMKSAQTGSPVNKPEICIDLAGALIEWAKDKSSRKNVFQISTVLGLQILIQDDSSQTSKEWFDAIKNAIANLPSGIVLNTTNKTMNDYDITFPSPEEVKKPLRLTRKVRNSSSQEDLDSTPAERKTRIRDKLLNFFLRRPSIDTLREKGILREEPVFGCHLNNLCSREKTTIPRFVQKCTSLIEKKDMKADGLYRASGNLSQVQKIRFQVNQDDMSCLEMEEDVHVLTGALKMFFRELKEPLIPFNTFEKFLASIMNPDKSCRLQTFCELVLSLPRPNYDTLKHLLVHLLRVTEYSEQNRMHIQNLAIVFGPTLMWPEIESTNLALDMMHQNQIIEFLLMEFNTLFR